jgi:hypothetical protein
VGEAGGEKSSPFTVDGEGERSKLAFCAAVC